MKAFLIIITLLLYLSLGAKTFVREYSYKAGEDDSKISARAIALEQVKRLLLEEVGVYIQSSIRNQESEIDGKVSSLTSKDIQVLSAGITQTKVLMDSWDGETYWLKAEITLDESDVLKQLDELVSNKKDKLAVEASQKATIAALEEIERLRNELAQVKDKTTRTHLRAAYRAEADKLSANEWKDKGIEAMSNSDYILAASYYQKAVELNPTDRDSWYSLATMNNINSNFEEAVICYRKCLELDAYFVLGWTSLAGVYLKKQDYNRASEYTLKALEIDSTTVDAYVMMGEISREQKEYDKSVVWYQKALKFKPESYEAYFGMIATYEAMLNVDKVIECYQKLMEFDPEYAYEARHLAEIYEQIFDYPNTIKYYRKVLEAEPDDFPALMYLGEACFNNGDYAEAILSFKQAQEMEPDNFWVLNNLGKTYLALGDVVTGNAYYIQSARKGDLTIRDWCEKNGIYWRE